MSLSIKDIIAKVVKLHRSDDAPITPEMIGKAWDVVNEVSPSVCVDQEVKLKPDFKFDKIGYVEALGNLTIMLHKYASQFGNTNCYVGLDRSNPIYDIHLYNAQKHLDFARGYIDHKHKKKNDFWKRQDAECCLVVLHEIFRLISIEILQDLFRRDWYSWISKDFNQTDFTDKIQKLKFKINNFEPVPKHIDEIVAHVTESHRDHDFQWLIEFCDILDAWKMFKSVSPPESGDEKFDKVKYVVELMRLMELMCEYHAQKGGVFKYPELYSNPHCRDLVKEMKLADSIIHIRNSVYKVLSGYSKHDPVDITNIEICLSVLFKTFELACGDIEIFRNFMSGEIDHEFVVTKIEKLKLSADDFKLK